MRKAFVDTNIVVDLFMNREPFVSAAAVLFSKADNKEIQLYISALTVANAHFILTKGLDRFKFRAILRKFEGLVEIIPLDKDLISRALNEDSFVDFEDAVQYYSAIKAQAECIITRNLKDFKNARIPVFTAQQFLATLD